MAMPTRSMKEDDPLEDFTRRKITLDGITKLVYVAGSGPAVIVMSEMPGISPHVARFARWVRDAGFMVYMPSLFGRDGAVPEVEEGGAVFQRACVSAEFRALAANQTSPVTHWLRALARLAHQQCGGPGVGAIGLCLSGGFVLSLMVDKSVLAPVMSEPALPLALLPDFQAALGVSPDELKEATERSRSEDIPVMGLRFSRDWICPARRFDTLKQQFGNRFIKIEIPSEPGDSYTKYGIPRCAHSVLTEHYDSLKKYTDAFPHKDPRLLVFEFLDKQLKSSRLPSSAPSGVNG